MILMHFTQMKMLNTSTSDDDQKGTRKETREQGQKRKVQTKDAASEDNIKKTK